MKGLGVDYHPPREMANIDLHVVNVSSGTAGLVWVMVSWEGGGSPLSVVYCCVHDKVQYVCPALYPRHCHATQTPAAIIDM
jgi:hypothetical protein